MIATSEIERTTPFHDPLTPVIEEIQSWLLAGITVVAILVAILIGVWAFARLREAPSGPAPKRIGNDQHPRIHPRNLRRLDLENRLESLNKQLNSADAFARNRNMSDREHLTSKRDLVVAELTHIKSRHSQVDPHKFDGLSRGALSSERRKHIIRKQELLEDFSNRLVKPGPIFRTALFTNNDELDAIEGTLLNRQGYSMSAEASQTESRSAQNSHSLKPIIDLHEKLCDRWAEWHTDLGLLTEFPAIHDVQHEEFARRIIDAYDSAKSARTKAEAKQRDIPVFSAAVKEFKAALDDGEYKARLIARGPALDPVLARIMTNAETLLTKIRDYQAGNAAVSWAECQVAAEGLTKLLKPVIGHQANAIPELEATIARELEATKH